MAYFTYLWSGVFLGGEITIITHWSIRFRLGGFFRRSVLAWSPKSCGDLKLVEQPWCALQAGKVGWYQNGGGKTAVVDTPLVVFFKSSPFFGGCGLNYMIHIYIYTYITFIGLFLWSRRVVWIGFFLTAASGINISFRSWQGSASDWRQAVGSTSTMGFPPGARRLELTKKTTPGERGAWNLPKIGFGTSMSKGDQHFRFKQSIFSGVS